MYAQDASQNKFHGTAALFEKRHVHSLSDLDDGMGGVKNYREIVLGDVQKFDFICLGVQGGLRRS